MLYIKEKITHENLLYSTETSTQCFVLTYMEKKTPKRGDVCIHIADSLCYTIEADNIGKQLYSNKN